MTQSIALNANNDLFLNTSGNLAFVSGLQACVQNCQTAMQTLYGEMIYNVKGGMPYQTVAWDNYRPALFEASAREILLGVQDVTDILAFSQSLVNNVLHYTATIKTIYGKIIFSPSISPLGNQLDINFYIEQSPLG